MVHSTVGRRALQGKKEEVSYSRIFSYIGLWFLLVASLFALFVLLLYKPFLQIEHISVTGTHVVHPYDIGTAVQEKLAKKWMYVVPRDSWITLPQKSLNKYIRETFDRVEDVTLSVRNFDTLVIEIVEWQPSFLWCNSPEIATTSQECWFMDRDGHIFSRAPYFSPGVYPMFVTKESSLDETLGAEKIDPAVLAEVLVIYRSLEDRDISIETMSFGEEQDLMFMLASINGVAVNNATLAIERTVPLAEIHQNLDLLFVHDMFRKKFETDPMLLQYIDLRFDGKLLFKFIAEDVIKDESTH